MTSFQVWLEQTNQLIQKDPSGFTGQLARTIYEASGARQTPQDQVVLALSRSMETALEARIEYNEAMQGMGPVMVEA